MSKSIFGSMPSGQKAHIYRLVGAGGTSAEITDLGASLVSLHVPMPGKAGSAEAPEAHDTPRKTIDVICGPDDVSGFLTNGANFGAVVGRYANRIGGASFELGEKHYTIPANEGPNSLHSGPDFWHHRLWTEVASDESSVEFVLKSKDGDQGYPGAVEAHVTYTLTPENGLTLEYYATADVPTIINLTNHSYFNLNGHAAGTARYHRLVVDAEAFTQVAAGNIPTGVLLSVEDTPLDLRGGPVINEGLVSGFTALDAVSGYDHNYVLSSYDPADTAKPRYAATLTADKSGISMDVFTTLPGMQVYSGNFMGGEQGKGGHTYNAYDAVCLETQYYPDSIHHANFPSVIFGPERPYRSVTEYRFR